MTAPIRFAGLYPWQLQFLNAKARYVLLSGGRGAGKTKAAILKDVVYACRHPGAVMVLATPVYRQSRNALVDPLIEALAKFPKRFYTVHDGKTRFQFRNGSIIHIYNLKDPGRLKGLNADYARVDEFTELRASDQAEVWTELQAILRSDRPFPKQLVITTNPSGQGTHLYQEFWTNYDPLKHWRYTVTSYDNPMLPMEYLRDLEAMPDILRRRYLLGEWTTSEGQVFAIEDRRHVVDTDPPGAARYFLAFDWGFVDPFVCLICAVVDGSIHVVDELVKTRHTDEMLWSMVQSKLEKLGGPKLAGFTADSADPDRVFWWGKRLKLPYYQPSKDRLPGWLTLLRLIEDRTTDRPRITFHSRCSYTVRSMRSLEWTTQGKWNHRIEDVAPGEDHAADALRYVVMARIVPAIGEPVASPNMRFTGD